jgi:hypothetical protein
MAGTQQFAATAQGTVTPPEEIEEVEEAEEE